MERNVCHANRQIKLQAVTYKREAAKSYVHEACGMKKGSDVLKGMRPEKNPFETSKPV
ncbi:MAG: hypothetical protein JRF30_00265 [Deltaproteobacteria bacterium]|nr:hypothetical protein [Deltaproteobacteria bacterium]